MTQRWPLYVGPQIVCSQQADTFSLLAQNSVGAKLRFLYTQLF